MLTEEEMLSLLKTDLSEHRFIHTLGVRDTSVALAKLHGANVDVCRIAATLHDCAKYMGRSQMLEIIDKYGIKLYPGESDNNELLHAPAGAAMAREKYGVKDESILSAIRNHTLGPSGMSSEDAIVFVADFIEPNRKSFDGLENVRQLAEKDINAAVGECKRLTREYCMQKGKVPLEF
ncbi:MAG: bis(5'-nucleosyl)-tetraphosphatase (symmetrical) YqeK [Clostridiales bacterium]|nr:bis(5'-nucleosyl)-tetraphosphatase (symmetrical) YqeK [Clostridiales bacterium]